MLDHLPFLRDRPPRRRRRYAHCVDVLSDAIAVARTGRPHSGRVHRAAPFGIRVPPVAGAGFHVVLRGSCWLFPTAGEPVRLGVGDVAFLPGGAAHGLADTPATPLVDVSIGLDDPAGLDDPGNPNDPNDPGNPNDPG